MSELLDVALQLHDAGCCVLRARADGSKLPVGQWAHYQRERPSRDLLRQWFERDDVDGLGIVCGAVSGNVEMLELDDHEGEGGLVARIAKLAAIAEAAGLGDLWRRVVGGYTERTPGGGVHWLIRVDGGEIAGNAKLAMRADKKTVIAETRGEGGWTVLAPSGGRTHPTGRAWTQLTGGPATIATLTPVERDQLHALLGALDERPQQPSTPPANVTPADSGPVDVLFDPRLDPPRSSDDVAPGADFEQRATWAQILEPHGWTRVFSDADGTTYWRRPGKTDGQSATTNRPGSSDCLYVFSSSTVFDTEVPYSKFGAYALLEHNGDHSAAARTLRAGGYGSKPKPRPSTPPSTPSGQQPQRAVSLTAVVDAGLEQQRGQLRLAERFASTHADTMRYAHGLGWLSWDGCRWSRDTDGAAMRNLVDVVKAATREAETLDDEQRKALLADVRKCESASGAEGALRLASALRPIAVAADELDADRQLFNTRDGTLDLLTGELRPHSPGDLITKVAGCGYDPSARSALFERFVGEALPDEETRAYVQRLLGYAMLGVVRDHVLPIFTGSGGNGKGTLLELAMKAFGDYAIEAEPDLLVDRGSTHPTGQADLMGVRLAIASETDEGRTMAAARVKRLTGGDRMRARRMRQDFVEWQPSHTVILMTNHKPRVDADDDAIWRRLSIVPFDVKFDPPDTTLPERLALELPAVLAWCAAGHAEYATRGLDAPAAVKLRTEQYRASSDALARFLDERTIPTPAAHVGSRELFAAWSAWCHATGENPGSEVAFAEAMQRRGHEKRTSRGRRQYVGLMLARPDDDDEGGDSAERYETGNLWS